ncbi:hypothetical protein FDC45_09005 [Clostridium botulinum]|uniref:Uncharacterized protein n=1 Tax=Clostridium botulinum TaxID=1491 RepID=A0A846JGX0_CLOBO|nr:hypothetical protein [Clostridium botulinum]ACA57483.1 hypothetical protein CLK_A0036 [Clostridium botulinum A3 str. Loch Maree]NFH65566.1 hypothetical protein [Clostridium botulinum]NFJ09424.1 hypothetical protein [Clostridium botulinum]NFK16754.1 hypothetical protein [Clostridium botulinum]NFM93533.1 hypothetical protein [Clostridium botulinum]
MKNEEYCPIPTKDQMRNRRNIQIHESSNEELYKLYDEVSQGIMEFGSVDELSNDFKRDKDLIKLELKNRGLQVTNWIYKLKLYFNIGKS